MNNPLTLKPDDNAANEIISGDIYVFGAKSIAIGAIRAIRQCYNSCSVKGCVVSSLEDNPKEIEGLKVEELKEFAARYTEKGRRSVVILVATPVYVQEEINDTLRAFGFEKIICLDSDMEERLMHRYFSEKKLFKSLKDISASVKDPVNAIILAVCHNADRKLRIRYENDPWVRDIQVGAALTDIKMHELNDMTGDNISEKNPVYCELTGLYWMWKNMINKDNNEEYFGLYQYRRVLDIGEDDLRKIAGDNVDVVLPYPMIHVPDIREHHERYTNEAEWGLLLDAVRELSPEYTDSYEAIFCGQYLYNYNMFLAKGKVVDELCSWMFPIFSRLEGLCRSKGIVPAKRYIAYFGESMMTWFFMKNADRFNIAHTGRMLRI